MAGPPNMPDAPEIPQDDFSARLAALREQVEQRANGGAPGPQAEEQTSDSGGGPVGQGDYVVKPGDCISSIAKETGHFWETIWTDPGNSELKEVRKDPNVLLPEDRVTIPEKEPKLEPGGTEMRHRFVRKGEPAGLRLRVLVEGAPVAEAPYTLEVAGQTIEDITGVDGMIEAAIPGDARRGKLKVRWRGTLLEYDLSLGRVDPIDTVSGVQQRLNNLGYTCGGADGVFGPRTKSALTRFQRDNEISNPTGEPDGATREKLKEKHGC